MTERRYAAETKIPESQTLLEIEELLKKHGATAYARSWEQSGIRIVFILGARHYRLELPFPDPQERQFQRDGRGPLTSQRQQARIFQARDSRARALFLMIKALLEAAAIGLIAVEDSLLPYLVLPNRQTLREWADEQIPPAVLKGEMPALLPGNPHALKALNERNPASAHHRPDGLLDRAALDQ